MYPDRDLPPPLTAPRREPRGTPLEVSRLLRVVLRRKRVLGGALIFGLALGVVASRFVEPEYRASTILIWDDQATTDATTIERRLRTAVDEIKLTTTLERTRANLQIGMTLEELGSRVSASTTAGSDLLQVSVSATSGSEAAKLSDEVARAFLEHRAEQVRTVARDRAARLAKEIDATTKAMAIARAERDRFRAANGIVDLASERTLAVGQRAVLSNDAERAHADAGVERARAGDLASAASLLPAVSVLSETESRPDIRRLAEAENELAMVRGYLTEDNPRVQAKAAEVAKLRERTHRTDNTIRAERIVGRNPIHDFIQQNKADAMVRAAAAERRHDAYLDLATKARLRVEELNKLEGQAAELDGRLAALEARVAALRGERQAALERAELGGADLHVMASASVPPYPFKSKRRAIGMALPIVVVIVALLMIVVHALLGLRVATPRELAYWSSIPVVAACERLSDPAELDAIASELAPLVAPVGTTLITSASTYERDTANALATRLETLAVSNRDGRVELLTDALDSSSRRRVRAATRVLVVAAARRHRPWLLRQLTARLGRSNRIGLVAVEVGSELALLVDRVGDANELT